MNAVEIEEAISALAEQAFDPAEFPFAFLEAFGNKATTIKRLRTGSTNSSDLGGVLQRNNIHLVACEQGQVPSTLQALRQSPSTAKGKAKFILATDGAALEAEDLTTGETIACQYKDFPNHFGFFLPLAGITTVKQIRNNPIDIQATGRLNRLYVELLKTNEDWASDARRHDMNHFMARLIFCFFAEDTDIFGGENLFTSTIEQMSDSRSDNTEQVIGELFRAMDTKIEDRAAAKLPRWADAFPYVNGGLFAGSKDIPKFSRIARSYLLHAGSLNWQQINPDIFGSMIQAVADDDERGELGMHYTSVPNIEKVLNPLFLDDLRAQLDEAGENARKLLNLRKRLANIRVFDPACGSGNFLVIAYIRMREIEAEIQIRRGEANDKSWIKLENFYGIELKDFAAEVARLSLLIAEFQCDVRFIGQKEAKALVLPLRKTGQIHHGNALRLDWLSVCADDEGEAETYICGNPPYLGKGKKEQSHIDDMEAIFSGRSKQWGYVDYVGCWFILASDFCLATNAKAAIVATNSVCQGRQLPQLWPCVLKGGIEISFAHLSFKWSNSAVNNAGVICVVIGISKAGQHQEKQIYDQSLSRSVKNINAYLVAGDDVIVESRPRPLSAQLPNLVTGSVPNDDGNLILSVEEKFSLLSKDKPLIGLVKPFMGSADYLQGKIRYCLLIDDSQLELVNSSDEVKERLIRVRQIREKSKKKETREILSKFPHKFQHRAGVPEKLAIIVPSVSSERREWFPAGVVSSGAVISNLAFMMLDVEIWNFSIVTSKLHQTWISTICGKLKNDIRYSNTLGWNTFPLPMLTEQNRLDLTKCAEDILLARESHFPATIADLYDPEKMPDNLREAHERNDEVLERIYIGRRFKNDTERLEKLFELYTKMTAKGTARKAN
ncbi:DNA methyltransferase [Spongiibacter sp.]|uniref:class I SAM-dependent DNA methyltransferase n=1 Tax=Spongiibacter sp. TaxID=2024860 RepID=UPI000C6ADB53|nr:DNA methyltransferase [Spongiibacter sp.]MAY40622.1 lactate dehydrogenase [Spongiibacter sp.]MBI59524.1 lactate dehydrogenase [Spongiibacter sp.]